ncbi:zinc finger protein 250-like [Mauremys reevesii]|uniref:zinc finger protein 250-like n=1 Tax=Mauremys reevesii TaxID=260615 RepID=UPI00193EC77F|nr:zinc finger protein 250-like [Mauremys reevesii]
MQENYETVTSLEFPVFPPDEVSQPQQDRDPWVPDLHDSEESEILSGTCPREESFSQFEICPWLKETAEMPDRDIGSSQSSGLSPAGNKAPF